MKLFSKTLEELEDVYIDRIEKHFDIMMKLEYSDTKETTKILENNIHTLYEIEMLIKLWGE